MARSPTWSERACFGQADSIEDRGIVLITLAERSEGTFALCANASLMWAARGRGATAMSAGGCAKGMSSDFQHQVADGLALPFSGWDFSPIETRWRRGSPPWDYAGLLREKIRVVSSMVDLGTGGGEFLASLAPLPRVTYATEGYLVNLPIASRRLTPMGVSVLPIGLDLHIPLPGQQRGVGREPPRGLLRFRGLSNSEAGGVVHHSTGGNP